MTAGCVLPTTRFFFQSNTKNKQISFTLNSGEQYRLYRYLVCGDSLKTTRDNFFTERYLHRYCEASSLNVFHMT